MEAFLVSWILPYANITGAPKSLKMDNEALRRLFSFLELFCDYQDPVLSGLYHLRYKDRRHSFDGPGAELAHLENAG